jgi:hypothetical protein
MMKYFQIVSLLLVGNTGAISTDYSYKQPDIVGDVNMPNSEEPEF